MSFTETTHILCDDKGNPVLVQLPFVEYEQLLGMAEEADQLSLVLQKLQGLTSFGSVADAPAQKETPRQAAEPKADSPPVASEPRTEAPVAEKEQASEKPRSELKIHQPAVIPTAVSRFLSEKDSSSRVENLIETFINRLSVLCGKRITVSLHRPYLCFWDFDEWFTFLYGQIIDDNFYLSVEASLLPDGLIGEIWTPPKGLCEKDLIRFRVDAVTDVLLSRLNIVLEKKLKNVA
jgi:hypothetical protein